eukprot:scaffold44848_cov66-Phaeocystis_antarctica.AAC.9
MERSKGRLKGKGYPLPKKLCRKHPPVSGGKRPLCTLGVPPGRSRGIGGCARAPCVFLDAAEGMA